MTEVIARDKVKGKHFEVLVDVDSALKFKKTQSGEIGLAIDVIFTDAKKGERAKEKDLMDCFGTDDANEIAKKIILRGEVQIPQEYREKERAGKVKQVIDFLSRNAVDPRSDRPYTAERIERALDEAGVNIKDKSVESQITDIVSQLAKIIPIKVETKKLKLTIPSRYTGQVYGLIQTYKESEEWLANGDLIVTINLPIGLQMDFYDKLNGMTHGSVLSEEIKEK